MAKLIKISSVSYWLQQSEVASLAPATERIAKAMAGRVRYLYELATGTAAFTDGEGSPRNPQSRLGIDHSGPPWGNAFPHPMWVQEGLPASSDVFGEKPAITVPNGSTVSVRARFIVRPFQGGLLVPYSRAYLGASGASTGGAGTSTVTFRLYDGPTIDTPSRTATLTSTGVASASLSTPVWTAIEPTVRRSKPRPTEARWPTTERLIEISNTSGVSMDILSISLNQFATRSH
jgi:hypothetical protein